MRARGLPCTYDAQREVTFTKVVLPWVKRCVTGLVFPGTDIIRYSANDGKSSLYRTERKRT